MNQYEINSTYRQFYVADAGLDPDAPNEWADEHLAQHFNARENIAALVTDGDISARICCYAPGERSSISGKPNFEITSEIDVPTGIIQYTYVKIHF